jgi:hypothetical protein
LRFALRLALRFGLRSFAKAGSGYLPQDRDMASQVNHAVMVLGIMRQPACTAIDGRQLG